MDAHAISMNQTKMAKKMFGNKPSRISEVRGPILRWLEDEENDLRELTLNTWRQKEQKTEEWAICR